MTGAYSGSNTIIISSGDREIEVDYDYRGYLDPGRTSPPDLAYPPESEHEAVNVVIRPAQRPELNKAINALVDAYSAENDR